MFEVCKLIQVQAGRFYHIRDNNVFIGRGKGCGESLYLLDGENLPGRPQSDQKMIKLMACIHFLVQMKLCPQKNVLFLLI